MTSGTITLLGILDHLIVTVGIVATLWKTMQGRKHTKAEMARILVLVNGASAEKDAAIARLTRLLEGGT